MSILYLGAKQKCWRTTLESLTQFTDTTLILGSNVDSRVNDPIIFDGYYVVFIQITTVT